MEDRPAIFSSKFRTPRLPPVKELRLLKVWEMVFELMDIEAELAAKYGSRVLLFDVVTQKRLEKEAANPDFLSQLRKELSLDTDSSRSKPLQNAPKLAHSKSSLQSKSSSAISDADAAGIKHNEFWYNYYLSIKDDHPDELMSRWLVKGDVDAYTAFSRIIGAVRWRCRETELEDILRGGEEGAQKAVDRTEDEVQRQIAQGFLDQIQQGKNFAHGIDWEGRPVVMINIRLHQPGYQPPEAMRRSMLWQIESIRFMLGPSITNAVLLYDLSRATAKNLDLNLIKFMIDIFRKYYPSAAGLIILHNAPKVFEPSWNVIKTWLKPETVARVKFTRSVKELEQYIPRQSLPKTLGVEEGYEFEYKPIAPGENDLMKNVELKAALLKEREAVWKGMENLTKEMIRRAKDGDDYTGIKKKRHEFVDHMRASYWRLDPFIRARSHYDRTGEIGFRRDCALMAERLTYGAQKYSGDLSGLGSMDDLSLHPERTRESAPRNSDEITPG